MAGEMVTSYAPSGAVTTATQAPAGMSPGGFGFGGGGDDFFRKLIEKREAERLADKERREIEMRKAKAEAMQREAAARFEASQAALRNVDAANKFQGGGAQPGAELERAKRGAQIAQYEAIEGRMPQSRHVGFFDYGMQPDYEKFTGAQRQVFMPQNATGDLGPTPEEARGLSNLSQPAPTPWTMGDPGYQQRVAMQELARRRAQQQQQGQE